MIAALFIVVLAIAAVIGWCGAVEANQRAKRCQAEASLWKYDFLREHGRRIKAERALAAERETGLSW